MEIVFHIDDLANWPIAMSNIENTVDHILTRIVVVVNGPAITGYLTDDVKQFITKYHGRITFHACHNAMKSHDVTDDQLPDQVVVVPNGIIDLAKLQNSGYRYIKP